MDIKVIEPASELSVEQLRRKLESFQLSLDGLSASDRLAQRMKIEAVERQLRQSAAATTAT